MKERKQTDVGTVTPHERLSDEVAVARRFEFAPNTLAKWRCQGRGPRFIKLGGRIRYRLSDVEAYLRERTVEPGALEAR